MDNNTVARPNLTTDNLPEKLKSIINGVRDLYAFLGGPDQSLSLLKEVFVSAFGPGGDEWDSETRQRAFTLYDLLVAHLKEIEELELENIDLRLVDFKLKGYYKDSPT